MTVRGAISVDDLLAVASSRRPLDASDGRSGAELEVVTIGGRPFVLKHVGGDGDWIARASGDLDCRAVRVWTSGLLDRLPACLDHAVVAAGYGATRRHGALLQRDVGPWLVPPGDATLPLDHHRRFLDHMAALHATFWGVAEPAGLLPLEDRYLLLASTTVEVERARGRMPAPLAMVLPGLAALADLAPDAAEVVGRVLAGPSCLVEPLRRTPWTLLHGDWKAGNLGVGPDGRTILLDWSLPGPGPACADLAWYLAINAARLPEAKEGAIVHYRTALEHRGVDTSGWWEQQLGLSLIGAFAVLGWEKALGEPEELGWWVDQVGEAVRWVA